MAGTIIPLSPPPYAFNIASKIKRKKKGIVEELPFASAANARAFRSAFERRVVRAAALAVADAGVLVWYRPYTLFSRGNLYRAPTLLLSSGLLIDAISADSLWSAHDRMPLQAVRLRWPGLDIRLVLEDPEGPMEGTTGATYREFCERREIPWAHGTIPKEWLAEPPTEERITALENAAFRSRPVRERSLEERRSLATRERSQAEGNSPSLHTETNDTIQQ